MSNAGNTQLVIHQIIYNLNTNALWKQFCKLFAPIGLKSSFAVSSLILPSDKEGISGVPHRF